MSSFAKPSIPVVINADDFGYGQEVNAAILDAGITHCISSATVMANGPAVSEALMMATHLPHISFGIHLNLTEFRPLLPAHDLRHAGLVDSDGNFAGQTLRQVRPSPRVLQACYQELDAQLQSLHERGLKPSHLDSHHHIHTIPWLLPVVWRLQRKYNIVCMRNTLNIYPGGCADLPRRRLLAAKRLWRLAARMLGTKMTQRFASLQVFMCDPLRPEFTEASSIELMCHPGQAGFEAETQQMRRLGAALLPNGFHLQNYREMIRF